MQELEAVLFDLDGTLLHTLDDLHASTNRALAAFGFPERTREEVRCFVGNGIRVLIERAVPAGTKKETADAVLEVFRKDYAAHTFDHTVPYPGVLSLLSALREHRIKVAVVSNKADFAVQTLVHHFFEGAVDFAIGESEGIRKKPAPDMLDAALRALGVDRKNAVYVGDSEVDFETAENARIDLCLVTWGFRDRSVLLPLAERTSPGRETTLISSPEELRRFCKV